MNPILSFSEFLSIFKPIPVTAASVMDKEVQVAELVRDYQQRSYPALPVVVSPYRDIKPKIIPSYVWFSTNYPYYIFTLSVFGEAEATCFQHNLTDFEDNPPVGYDYENDDIHIEEGLISNDVYVDQNGEYKETDENKPTYLITPGMRTGTMVQGYIISSTPYIPEEHGDFHCYIYEQDLDKLSLS